MIRGMYSAASGIITCQTEQDVVSNNLANISTTGYKSQLISTKSFDQVYISNKDNKNNDRVTIGTMSNGVALNERVTNYDQGTITNTGVKTDFAIQGEGFFVVQRQEGNGTKNYYTRDGHFQIDNAGYLVTSSGDRVMTLNGGNLSPLYVGDANISARSDGSISLDGVNAGRLAVVNFPKDDEGNYSTLKEYTFNLYEGTNPQYMNNSYVVQESLEGSNVRVVEETSNMMSIMRRFESNTTVLKTLDSTLDKAVNRIGNV